MLLQLTPQAKEIESNPAKIHVFRRGKCRGIEWLDFSVTPRIKQYVNEDFRKGSNKDLFQGYPILYF